MRAWWVVRGVTAFSVLGMVWAFAIEPGLVVVHETSLDLPDYHGPRLKLALLSDLHVGAPHMTLDHLDEIVSTTNAERPDAVILLGDYVIEGVVGGHFVDPTLIASHLAKLRAPLGVFAVLGNHDRWYDGAKVEQALAANGIRVLENEVANAGGLWFAGLSDLWTKEPLVEATLAKVPPGAPLIAMTHNPDLFPRIPARVSLTVAGHTHGGQVRLPFIGSPIVPSEFQQRFARGLVVENGRPLFVTTGIGTSIMPLRFGVPPEIAVLTVEPSQISEPTRPIP